MRLLKRVVSCWKQEVGRSFVAKRLTAYVCLAIGVAGLALPILPGIPFLFAGLALLAPEHPIRKLMERWMPRRTQK